MYHETKAIMTLLSKDLGPKRKNAQLTQLDYLMWLFSSLQNERYKNEAELRTLETILQNVNFLLKEDKNKALEELATEIERTVQGLHPHNSRQMLNTLHTKFLMKFDGTDSSKDQNLQIVKKY